MAFSTTFRHSPTEPVRGREVDVNFDALGAYADATFLPLSGGTVSGTIVLTGTPPFSGVWDGWISSTSTWTYASSTTFTITGDFTTLFSVGDKIKLTQTTAKYFYVTAVTFGSPNTTVTVNGGSDYTLANAAITAPFYSKEATPNAFPQWFSYTPVWSVLSGGAPSIGNGTLLGRFAMLGRVTRFQLHFIGGTTTTYGGGVWRFTLPVTAAAGAAQTTHGPIGNYRAVDIGTADVAGAVEIVSTTLFQLYHDLHSGAINAQIDFVTNTQPMTWTTGDPLYVQASYEI